MEENQYTDITAEVSPAPAETTTPAESEGTRDDIAERLDEIRAMLLASQEKDRTIASLHAEMSEQRSDMVSRLRDTILQAVVKIDARIREVERSSREALVLDNPEFERLRAQVASLAEFVADTLEDDFQAVVIDAAEGDDYDRARHCSIEAVPTSDAALDRKIASVVAPGYISLLTGRVLRQATVKTFRYTQPASPAQND